MDEYYRLSLTGRLTESSRMTFQTGNPLFGYLDPAWTPDPEEVHPLDLQDPIPPDGSMVGVVARAGGRRHLPVAGAVTGALSQLLFNFARNMLGSGLRSSENPANLQAMLYAQDWTRGRFLNDGMSKHPHIYSTFVHDPRQGHIYGFLVRMLLTDPERAVRLMRPLLLQPSTPQNIETTHRAFLKIIDLFYKGDNIHMWHGVAVMAAAGALIGSAQSSSQTWTDYQNQFKKKTPVKPKPKPQPKQQPKPKPQPISKI